MKNKNEMMKDLNCLLDEIEELNGHIPEVHIIEIPSIKDNENKHSGGIKQINNIPKEIKGCYWIDTDMPYKKIIKKTKTLKRDSEKSKARRAKRIKEVNNDKSDFGITYVGKDKYLKKRIMYHLLTESQMPPGYAAMGFNINVVPFNLSNWIIAYIKVEEEVKRSKIKISYLDKSKTPILNFKKG